MSQADLDTVHGVVDAFNRRDADAMWALYGGSFEFHSTLAALVGEGGVYRGRADIDRYFADLDDVLEDWQIREHVCVDAGEGCVVLIYRVAGHGRSSGVPVDHDFGIVFRLRNGKLVRGETHVDPGDALVAAGIAREFGEELRLLRAYGAAVAEGDLDTLRDLLHPDAVWEHNLGSGSVEEGVYEGRESIVRLFTRIIEVWESLRPQARDVTPLRDGEYRVRGELHAKHRLTAAEVVTPYEQRIEVRDGLLFRAWMLVDEGIHVESHEGAHAVEEWHGSGLEGVKTIGEEKA